MVPAAPWLPITVMAIDPVQPVAGVDVVGAVAVVVVVACAEAAVVVVAPPAAVADGLGDEQPATAATDNQYGTDDGPPGRRPGRSVAQELKSSGRTVSRN